MKTIPTVTIVIPAFNEEGNIGELLTSVVRQKTISCTVTSILVMSDGSTDSTDRIVRSFAKNHPQVRLLRDGKRLGKSRRLMMLYRKARSDYLIQFDADVVLENPYTVEYLVAGFTSRRVVAVGGDRIAVSGTTPVSILIRHRAELWRRTRNRLADPHTMLNCFSCILALRTGFARRLTLRPDISSESQLIFCEIQKQKKRFRYCPRARVYYQVPSTLGEYQKQSNRFSHEYGHLVALFGEHIRDYDRVPHGVQVGSFLTSLREHPILTTVTEIYFRVLMPKPGDLGTLNTNGFWEQIKTTKTGINIHLF